MVDTFLIRAPLHIAPVCQILLLRFMLFRRLRPCGIILLFLFNIACAYILQIPGFAVCTLLGLEGFLFLLFYMACDLDLAEVNFCCFYNVCDSNLVESLCCFHIMHSTLRNLFLLFYLSGGLRVLLKPC